MKKLDLTDTIKVKKYQNGCNLLIPALVEVQTMLNQYGVSFSINEVKTLLLSGYDESELRQLIFDKKTAGNNLEINGLQLDREKVRDMVHLPGLPEIIAKLAEIRTIRHEDCSIWDLLACVGETDGVPAANDKEIKIRATTVLTGKAVDVYEKVKALSDLLTELWKMGVGKEVNIEEVHRANVSTELCGWEYRYSPDVKVIFKKWNGR